MELTRRLSQDIEELLRPATYSIAIKLLASEEEIPQKGIRPKKNLGERLALCQGYGIVRRMGRTVIFGPEDHQCPPVVMCLGIKPLAKNWEEGLMAYPFCAKTMEIGASLNKEHLPRMEPADRQYIILAPLEQAEFVPDTVLVYCNAAQAHRLVMAQNFHTGKALDAKLTERMGCLRAVITAMQSGTCQFTLPGVGERAMAFCEEDAIVFGIPYCRFEEICIGLEETHKKGGARYPSVYPALMRQAQFPAPFYPVLEELGLK